MGMSDSVPMQRRVDLCGPVPPLGHDSELSPLPLCSDDARGWFPHFPM